ncbi:TPA: hypothetical protein ACUNF5_002730 [Burkholderia orbicola]
MFGLVIAYQAARFCQAVIGAPCARMHTINFKTFEANDEHYTPHRHQARVPATGSELGVAYRR